jgi:hypothetical protein
LVFVKIFKLSFPEIWFVEWLIYYFQILIF